MKFGKLEDISTVDFTLPQEPESNEVVMHKHEEVDRCQLYVGLTAWGNKLWKGKWYPAKTKAADFLSAYSKQFNSIELNTTYYRIPKADTILKWKEQTPDDFRFCPKVVKWISHKKDLSIGTDEIEKMIDTFVLLEEKLGPFFMQLSPNFDASKIKVLANFLDFFPKGLSISIELRHPSWFENSDIKNELQDLFVHHQQNLLITDVAGRRDVAHMLLTNDYLMVRWVGNGLHETDYQRIDAWVDRLLYYKKIGIKRIYFFPHEPENLLAPEITHYLCNKLNQTGHFHVRGPENIDDHPAQLNLFR